MQSSKTLRPGRVAGLIALSLAPALIALPAAAQDTGRKMTPKAAAAPKSKANVMTRDELRSCMDEQDRLQVTRTRIDQEQAALEQQKARIQAMDADRQKRATALDPADEAGRKAIEEETTKRDQEAETYNAKLASLRDQAGSFDTSRQAWVQRCTTKDFDEMDEAAIKKERAQAARAKK